MKKQDLNKVSEIPLKFKDLKKFFADYLEGNEKKDKYGLSWAGKVNAKKEALTPTSKTLNPQKDESKNWDETGNVFIEGDNLEALKLLQKKYFEKIKMIYIDPPYNTGKDFIYRDNFRRDLKVELEESGEMKDGALLTTNAKTNGRFHSDWLNMMYSRLFLAHKLLRDDGVIFVSIDDNEVANLRLLMDEIFGEENFVGQFIVKSTPNARDYGHIGKMHEFVLFYSKNNFETETFLLNDKEKTFSFEDTIGGYNIHPLYNSNIAFSPENRKNLFYPFYLNPKNKIEEKFFEIGLEKKENWIEIFPPKPVKNDGQFVWRWGKEKALKNLNEEIIGHKVNGGEYRIVQKMRHSDKLIRSMLLEKFFSSRRGTAEVEELFGKKLFDFPKPFELIKTFCQVATKEDDIILDFFAGSGTTAHAVMNLNAEDGGNRKYILVQLDEKVDKKTEAGKAGYKNIAEISRERIRRAGEKIAKGDVGFRSFKVSNSNYREWQAGDFEMFEEKLLEQAELFAEKPLIDNYEKINVVFELVAKEGFSLSASVSENSDFFEILDGDRKMFVDFGEVVDLGKVESLGLGESDVFVCFDSALGDSDKVNLNKSTFGVLVV